MVTATTGLNAGTVYCRIAVDHTGAVRNLVQFNSAVQSSADASTRDFGRIKAGFDQVAMAMTAVAIAGAGAVYHVLKVAGAFEQTKKAMTSMLGSSEKGIAFLNELRDFEVKTPFDMETLTKSARLMLALGIQAKDVIPVMTDLGDAVSAMGGSPELLQRIILAMGQMQAKGKVSGEEMRQFAEAGIPAWRYVAEAIGKTTAETMKLGEKGLIPAAQAIEAIRAGMHKDFGGAMIDQMDTLNGQLSSLKTKIWNAEVAIGTGLIPTFKAFAASIAKSTDRFNELTAAQKQFVATGLLTVTIGAAITAGLAILAKLYFDVNAGMQGVALARQAEAAQVAENTALFAGLVAELEATAVAEMQSADAALGHALTLQEDSAAIIANADASMINARARTAETLAVYNQQRAIAAENYAMLMSTMGRNAFTETLIAENNARVAETYATYQAAVAQERQTAASIRGAEANLVAADAEIVKATAMASGAAAVNAEATAQAAALRAQRAAFLGLTPVMWAVVAVAVAAYGAWKLYEYYQRAAIRATEDQIKAAEQQTKAKEAEISLLDAQRSRRQTEHADLARLLADYESLKDRAKLSQSEHLKLTQTKDALAGKMRTIRQELGMQAKAWDGNTASIKQAMVALVDFTTLERSLFIKQAELAQISAKGEVLATRKARQEAADKLDKAEAGMRNNARNMILLGPLAGVAAGKTQQHVADARAALEIVRTTEAAAYLKFAVANERMALLQGMTPAELDKLRSAAGAGSTTPAPGSPASTAAKNKPTPTVAEDLATRLTAIQQEAKEAKALGADYDMNAQKLEAYQAAITAYIDKGVTFDDARRTSVREHLVALTGLVAAAEAEAKAEADAKEQREKAAADYQSILTRRAEAIAALDREETEYSITQETQRQRVAILRQAVLDLLPYEKEHAAQIKDARREYDMAAATLARMTTGTDAQTKATEEGTAAIEERKAAEAARIRELAAQMAGLDERTQDVLLRDASPELQAAVLQGRRNRIQQEASALEAAIGKSTGVDKAQYQTDLAGKRLQLAQLDQAILDLLKKDLAAPETTRELFAGFGDALWNYRRDQRSITRYFDSIADDAAKTGMSKLWDTLRKDTVNADGTTTSSPLHRMVAAIASTGIGKKLGIGDPAKMGKLYDLGVGAYGAYQGAQEGKMSGAISGAAFGFQRGGPAGAAVGALAGFLFGDANERKRRDEDARRQRDQMIAEMRKQSNALVPFADILKSVSLNLLPNSAGVGADLATGYAAMSTRGAW